MNKFLVEESIIIVSLKNFSYYLGEVFLTGQLAFICWNIFLFKENTKLLSKAHLEWVFIDILTKSVVYIQISNKMFVLLF